MRRHITVPEREAEPIKTSPRKNQLAGALGTVIPKATLRSSPLKDRRGTTPANACSSM